MNKELLKILGKRNHHKYTEVEGKVKSAGKKDKKKKNNETPTTGV